jgi:hypothetical protein
MKQILYILVIVTGLLSCTYEKSASDSQQISLEQISFQGIKGNVYDAESGESLSARIVLKDEKGSIIDSYYSHIPGFYSNEDGSFEKSLEPCKYILSVFHGIDYQSIETELTIAPDQGYVIKANLKPWMNLKENGWVNGGGHCHLYTEKDQDFEMIQKVRQICLAQGVDFMCAAQGWAGYNDSTWRKGYEALNDNRFLLHYGSEMPKYRTGHTWWIGQTSTRNLFWETMDENYEQQYYQSHTAENWTFDDINFPYIPGIEVVQRFKKADNSVAIMAHPTSWWWQPRGEITKHTTNVASYLSFGLLAGKIWDGLVVMGYDHDHYIYQQLWFHVLNQGYRMPAISELDGGLGQKDRFYYGSMRTYYHIEGDFKISSVADAVRRGETFVTSGPIVMANVDEKYKIGEIIRPSNSGHKMNIEAWASGDKNDYLSWVILFRNGEIHKLWDLRDEKVRHFDEAVKIKESEKAWYVIKAYGTKTWQDAAPLDVLNVSDQLFHAKITPEQKEQHDVCITSPFYFWPEGVNDPETLISDINLSLTSVDGKEINNAEVEILINGASIKSIQVENGVANFQMPVHGMLKISSGNKTIYRSLFMDFKPHRDLLEKLASGSRADTSAPRPSCQRTPSTRQSLQVPALRHRKGRG